MIILPAIDIQDGRCVRLQQGRLEDQTVYSDHPAQMAAQWEEQGAEYLHVVDLNGAVEGKRINFDAICQILQAVKIPVQIGGGIRDIAGMEAYLSAGAKRVVLGTAAVSNPALVKDACQRFPGQIVIALDSRDGQVAIRGWQEISEQSTLDMAKQLEEASPAALLITDIQRDGMLTGPNLDVLRAAVETTRIPIIASGGVSSLKDIQDLCDIPHLYAAIVGKALYEEKFQLPEALAIKRSQG